jgi:rod shape-determining protein MreD
MKVCVYLLMAVLLTILEASLLAFLPIEFFKPDLGIPFIIYTTLFLGPHAGLLTAFFVGLLQEIFTISPPGSVLFTKMSIFVVATFMRNKLYIDSRYSFGYICAGSVVLESLLFLILSFASKGETANIANVLFYLLPNAIFTGFCSLFIFSVIEVLNMKYLERE